jgi:hypothetical protein
MKITRQQAIFAVLKWILYATGVAFYSFLTVGEVTKIQRDIFSGIVQENSLILAGIILVYLFTQLLPNWLGGPVRWSGLLGLAGVFLKGYWIIQRSAYFQVYGILPNVDAAEYYHNAIRLLVGFPAQGTTISRPFFPSFLSTILYVAKLDIHATLIILVALVILAVFLFGESVRARFGAIPAAMTVGMTFMFYSNYLGAFSSESLGLIFGCLGWIFLFECCQRSEKRIFFLGLAFLTLGMFTRAGALFILPMMVLAFLLFYRQKSDRVKYIAGAFVVFVVIYLVNSNILDILSAHSSYLFPNSLYSIYGMASGGNGWGYFKIARPDIWAMEEPARTQMLFQATVELIKTNPMVLIVNMLKQYYYFVLLGNTSVFSYLFTSIRGYNIFLMVILYTASIWTIVKLISTRKQLTSLILIAIFTGILLSIPFVPPQDESDMRAYAVSVPVMALFPALAIQDWLGWIWKKLNIKLSRSDQQKPAPGVKSIFAPVSFVIGIVIVILTILPTYMMQGISRPKFIAPKECSSGQVPISWIYQHKNSIKIVSDQDREDLYSISKERMSRLLHDLYMSSQIEVFTSMKRGYSVSQQINLVDGSSGWVLARNEIIQSGDGLYSGCAVFHDNENFYLFDFFKVEDAKKME